MSRYCQRRTCGEVETLQVIKEFLLDIAECTDLGENLLFDNRIVSIWEEEREHVWLYRIQRGFLVHCYSAHKKGDGAASALSCKRYYLTTIIPPALGQLYNISIMLRSFSNCYNPTYILFVRFTRALQQAICTIRDICWRACLDGTWALEVAQQQDSRLRTFSLQLANKVDVFNF